jgi:argininosuccinate lyase
MAFPLPITKICREIISIYDSLNTTIQCIEIMDRMAETLRVKPEEAMKQAVKKGDATEVADYLVKKA